MKKAIFCKKRIYFLILFLVFLGFFLLTWKRFEFILYSLSDSFGYMDDEHHWRVLEDFVRFKMPFRDYFHSPSYGFFYLLIQSLPYLIFKRTFFALKLTKHLFLPIMGVFLSFLIAKNILRKKHLIIIFLSFCLLFRVNWEFTSPRHLFAELGLSFFILYFLQKKKKYLLISGIVAGLSLLTSFEYGAAFNLAIFLVVLISLFSKRKLFRLYFSKFLLGEAIILTPYFIWFYVKGVFNDYVWYTLSGINNFYYSSPAAADSFPRFSEIINLIPISKFLIFGFPIEFLQKLNFYVVFLFFLVNILIILVIFIREKDLKEKDFIKISLIFYGLLAFIRVLDTPSFGYFTYGLVPFFLLLLIEIEEVFFYFWQKEKKLLKTFGFLFSSFLFLWFTLTSDWIFIAEIFDKKGILLGGDVQEKKFYPPVGWYIRKDFVEYYKEITDYILANTTEDDFLYVYPWGPYNHLTNRSSPTGFPLPMGHVRERIRQDLEKRKPKFVVINIYNNLGIANYGRKRGDVSRFFSLTNEDGPVFAGEGNVIEEFILENYQTVLRNKLAIVMKQRKEPIVISRENREVYAWNPEKEEKIELLSMQKRKDGSSYRVTGRDAFWSITFQEPILASDIAVEFKIDGDFLTKHFSRYFVNLLVFDEKGKIVGQSRVLARKDWQIDKIYLSDVMEVKKVKLEIGENTGLLWWLHPYKLAIKGVKFYNNEEKQKI